MENFGTIKNDQKFQSIGKKFRFRGQNFEFKTLQDQGILGKLNPQSNPASLPTTNIT